MLLLLFVNSLRSNILTCQTINNFEQKINQFSSSNHLICNIKQKVYRKLLWFFVTSNNVKLRWTFFFVLLLRTIKIQTILLSHYRNICAKKNQTKNNFNMNNVLRVYVPWHAAFFSFFEYTCFWYTQFFVLSDYIALDLQEWIFNAKKE